MFRFYKTVLNLKSRLQEQNQKKIFIFFLYHLNLFICCKTKLKIKLIFYRINSFATLEQPYFCCKTKLKKIKFIFYRMSLFYKQNEFFNFILKITLITLIITLFEKKNIFTEKNKVL